MMMKSQRAQLDPMFQNLRNELPEVLQRLKRGSADWYVSVFAESRRMKYFKANQKSQGMQSSVAEGVVLRVYDGFTLHECALDRLDKGSLLAEADRFIERVKSSPRPNRKSIPYQAPNWTERLKGDFEAEILSQIPANPLANTPVHFGTPQVVPLWESDEGAMAHAKKALADLRKHAVSLPASDPCSQPDFMQARVAIGREHYLFLDEEVNLSQSILRNNIVLVAMKGGESGREVGGGIGGQETLAYDEKSISDLFDYLRKSLTAERLKPGRYKLLMGPDVTGVFAHEAFGHSQEADTCARGRSKAWDLYRSKESVGNEHATILNNPAIFENADLGFGAWGSYYFDEEGWLAQKQVLVREGVLEAPMTNLTSALRLGVPRTANGKRENWSRGVYTRQTNTYFSEGELTLEELMSQVDYGFLGMNAAGGMEDPKGMGIQVGIAYLEEIVNGELTGKVFRGPGGGAVQMTGYTPDYLNAILGKTKIEANRSGEDKAKHPLNKVGGCGKYHKEIVVAGSGGPYMLVDSVLLG
jgi:predicted Zn-dependent protease